jgi:hypothetical protein
MATVLARPLEAQAVTNKMFRLFISYAREDEKVAIAVANAVQIALGPSAEVFIDSGLRFGLDFQEEIKTKLDETDAFIAIYSSISKPTFGFTGIEMGFFMHSVKNNPGAGFKRRIVPMFFDKPPDAVAEEHGVHIGISRQTLGLSFEEYEQNLNIDYDHNMVKFLREFQEIVDKMRESSGAPRIPPTPEQRDVLGIVRRMQLAIFSHLKGTPESTLKPQKQLILKTSDAALEGAGQELPPDAVLLPMGTGNPMAIFGLPNDEITWEEFYERTKLSKYRDSWVDAITSVVTSALRTQLDVDNSQLIVSDDEKNAFRIILTTGTRYFDGSREFNLYFVQYLKRGEFGDRHTTVLFKGLEITCRFRSLFLERNSEFSSFRFKMANAASFRPLARNMERELNLLRRDQLEVGLESPAVWAEFVDTDRLLKMAELWRPLEERIRQTLTEARDCDDQDLDYCRAKLVKALGELEEAIRPLNAETIAEMAEKLKEFAVAGQ